MLYKLNRQIIVTIFIALLYISVTVYAFYPANKIPIINSIKDYEKILENLAHLKGIDLTKPENVYWLFYGGRVVSINISKYGFLSKYLAGLKPDELVIGVYTSKGWVKLPLRIYDWKTRSIGGIYYHMPDNINNRTVLEIRLPPYMPSIYRGDYSDRAIFMRGAEALMVNVKFLKHSIVVPLYVFIKPHYRDYEVYGYGFENNNGYTAWDCSVELPGLTFLLKTEPSLSTQIYRANSIVDKEYKSTSSREPLIKKLLNDPVESMVIDFPPHPHPIPDGGGSPSYEANYVDIVPVTYSISYNLSLSKPSFTTYITPVPPQASVKLWRQYNIYLVKIGVYTIVQLVEGTSTYPRKLVIYINDKQIGEYYVYGDNINVIKPVYTLASPIKGSDLEKPIKFTFKINGISSNQVWNIAFRPAFFYFIFYDQYREVYNKLMKEPYKIKPITYNYFELNMYKNSNYQFSLTLPLTTPEGGVPDYSLLNKDPQNMFINMYINYPQNYVDKYQAKICIGSICKTLYLYSGTTISTTLSFGRTFYQEFFKKAAVNEHLKLYIDLKPVNILENPSTGFFTITFILWSSDSIKLEYIPLNKIIYGSKPSISSLCYVNDRNCMCADKALWQGEIGIYTSYQSDVGGGYTFRSTLLYSELSLNPVLAGSGLIVHGRLVVKPKPGLLEKPGNLQGIDLTEITRYEVTIDFSRAGGNITFHRVVGGAEYTKDCGITGFYDYYPGIGEKLPDLSWISPYIDITSIALGTASYVSGAVASAISSVNPALVTIQTVILGYNALKEVALTSNVGCKPDNSNVSSITAWWEKPWLESGTKAGGFIFEFDIDAKSLEPGSYPVVIKVTVNYRVGSSIISKTITVEAWVYAIGYG